MLPTFIYLDGTDRTGKTSLIGPLAGAINFCSIITDRGPVGFSVYDELYRDIPRGRYLTARCLDNTMTVLLYANVSILQQRGWNADGYEIYKHQAAFGEMAGYVRAVSIEHGWNHKLLYVNSNQPQKDIIKEILDAIKED